MNGIDKVNISYRVHRVDEVHRVYEVCRVYSFHMAHGVYIVSWSVVGLQG